VDRWPVLAEPVESVGTSANDCCAHAFISSELLTKFQPLDVDGEFSEIGEQLVTLGHVAHRLFSPEPTEFGVDLSKRSGGSALSGRTSDGAHVVFLS
jgi:hypothetical protein